MGIEHPQIDAILALNKQVKGFRPADILMNPGNKTPNQTALAAAIKLVYTGDPSQAHNIFVWENNFGHQATGPDYRNEQGAPDPHSSLWIAAMGSILKCAIAQNREPLINSGVKYFARLLYMCKKFWTVRGMRVPCARAKTLNPNWADNSYLAYMIMGCDKRQIGNPTNRDIISIVSDCSSVFNRIRKEVQSCTGVHFCVPVHKWDTSDGGFIAAFDHQTPMNDPMAWIVVNGSGDIVASGKTFDESWIEPIGVPETIL